MTEGSDEPTPESAAPEPTSEPGAPERAAAEPAASQPAASQPAATERAGAPAGHEPAWRRRPRAPRPPRSTSATGCLVGTLGLFALGGLALCLMSASIAGGGNLMEETVSADEGAEQKVLLIEHQGIIAQQVGGGMFDVGYDLVARMQRQFDRAAQDDSVAAVVLMLDTPGGTVTASDRIWHIIKEFRQKTHKPVVLHMGGICASGGYYIAAATDAITCEPTTITGSIGVILSGLNFHELMEKYGVKSVTIASGANKALLSPTAPVEEQHLQILQGMVDEAYERFITLVAEGRPGLELEEVRELADGRIYTAQQALELQLVDSIGYLDDSIETAKGLAGISAARVVRYARPPTLAEALAGNARVPSLELDAVLLDQLRTPRLMAIWRAGR